MKKFPWKGIAIGCFVMAVLVVARSAVTIGKAFYFGYDWAAKLVSDPWFFVGIGAAALGIIALLALSVQNKKSSKEA